METTLDPKPMEIRDWIVRICIALYVASALLQVPEALGETASIAGGSAARSVMPDPFGPREAAVP